MANRKKGNTIVISGSPGTGKTTLAKEISLKLKIPNFNLTEIALKNNFILDKDELRDTFIINEEELVNFMVNEVIMKNNLIVIEGHYSDIIPKGFVYCCIVLRLHPSDLEERLKSRGYNEIKIKENIQAEILGVCTNDCLNKYGKNNVFEIDTTNLTILNILDKAIKIIRNRNKDDLAGRINWLNKINDNMLRYYFND